MHLFSKSQAVPYVFKARITDSWVQKIYSALLTGGHHFTQIASFCTPYKLNLVIGLLNPQVRFHQANVFSLFDLGKCLVAGIFYDQ